MVNLCGCMVVWWTCVVVWLYGISFECHPNKRCILIVLRLGKVSLSTSIHDTADATTPILQERCFEEHVGNSWVLREGMMRLFDGFSCQFLWQMTRVLNLNTVIIYGNTNRTTCVVEKSMAECIRQGFSESFSRNFQLFFSRKANIFWKKPFQSNILWENEKFSLQLGEFKLSLSSWTH